jgi:hypothetical protein
VRSDANDVSGYLALVPGGRRAVPGECATRPAGCWPGFAESMSHGMPAHSRDGAAAVARATQKRHLLHVMRADVYDAHHSQLAGLDLGEGCIRYRSPAAAGFTIARPMLPAHRGEPRSGLLNGARHSQPMLNSPRQSRSMRLAQPGNSLPTASTCQNSGSL